MPRIENKRNRKRSLMRWIGRNIPEIIITILVLLLLAGTLDTWFNFRPRAEQITIEMRELNDKADQILEGLDALKTEITHESLLQPEATISRSTPVWVPEKRIIIKPLLSPSPTPTPTAKRESDKYAEFKRIVALEAYPTYEGYLMTASLILNMVDHGEWGNTINAVLSHPGCFSTWDSRKKPDIPDMTIFNQAIQDALDGKRNLPSGVMAMCTVGYYKSGESWFHNLELYKTKDGVMWFYYPE